MHNFILFIFNLQYFQAAYTKNYLHQEAPLFTTNILNSLLQPVITNENKNSSKHTILLQQYKKAFLFMYGMVSRAKFSFLYIW